MLEKVDIDEKMCQIFLVSVVPWTDHYFRTTVKVRFEARTQEPEKCDIFRQNLGNQASKVSIFANLQGLPGGVLNILSQNA